MSRPVSALTCRQRLSDWRNSASRGGLPLLGRDLREQAARPRTYVVRVCYTAVIAAIVFWNAGDIFEFFGDGLTAMDLGRGREIFDQIVLWQLAGILLIAPVISAGAIAEEKERDTLPVLLTTQLGPRLIIREKFYSRMFVVCGLVAMSLPLLGFSYSLGGVSQLQLIGSVVLLLTTVALTVALTMCLSAWCSSTAAALTLTLLVGIPVLGPVGAAIAASSVSTALDGLWIPVAAVVAGVAWIFLRLAESALVARAAVQARNPILETWRAIDRFFHDLNERFARGRLIIDDRTPLPDTEPVAWRLRYHKFLGQARYLVRVLLLLELPVAGLCLLGATAPDPEGLYVASQLSLLGLWVVTTMLLISTITSLPGAERTHQTIDVLLASPLPTSSIVQQFVRGLNRLYLVIALPFATVLVWRFSFDLSVQGAVQFFSSSIAAVTLLTLLVWLSLWTSLRIPSQLKATVVTSLLVAVWVVLPSAFIDADSDSWRGVLASLLSPGLLLRHIELRHASLGHAIGVAAIYGLIARRLRTECLTNADRWLNRC